MALKNVTLTIYKLLVLIIAPLLIVAFDISGDLVEITLAGSPQVITYFLIAVAASISILIFYGIILVKTFREWRKGNASKFVLRACVLSFTVISLVFGFKLVYWLSPDRFYYHWGRGSEDEAYLYKKNGLYCGYNGFLRIRSCGIYSIKGDMVVRKELYPPTLWKTQTRFLDYHYYPLHVIYDEALKKEFVKLGDNHESFTFYEHKDTLLVK